jgi:hypothetical protein
MLTKKVGGSRLALPPPFFAETRFWGASLSDKPITFSLLTRRSIGSLDRHDPSRRRLQAVANTIRALAQGFAEQDS